PFRAGARLELRLPCDRGLDAPRAHDRGHASERREHHDRPAGVELSYHPGRFVHYASIAECYLGTCGRTERANRHPQNACACARSDVGDDLIAWRSSSSTARTPARCSTYRGSVSGWPGPKSTPTTSS